MINRNTKNSEKFFTDLDCSFYQLSECESERAKWEKGMSRA